MSNTDFIFKKYKEEFCNDISRDSFYNIFDKAIKSGNNTFSFFQRYKESTIDLAWVEAIEKTIVALDAIIRKPRNFIEQNEEVIPIELSRKISEESVRHLAQHTSYIQKVNPDGSVVPNKILNIFKEETFATYENRFIYTLLINLQYFINKRLRALEASKIQSEFKFTFNSEFNIGKEKLKYDLSITSTEDITKEKYDFKINEDTSHMDSLVRVERLKKILGDFEKSNLIKQLHGVPLVKPPITKTNVLLKDKNFKKALALWQFIETYRDPGISIKIVDKEEMPDSEYIEDVYNTTLLNYTLFNKYNKPNKEDLEELEDADATYITPKINYKRIEEYTDDFNIDIDYVEKVFIDYVKRATSKRRKAEADILKSIKAGIKKHNDIEAKFLLDEEKLEAKALKLQQQKEKAKALKLKQKEEAKAKKLKELEKAKALKLKEREKAIQKAKALKLKEREKAKALKLKEQEKAKALKLKEQEKARALAKTLKLKQKEEAKAKEEKTN